MQNTRNSIKRYSEMVQLNSYEERLKYLQLYGTVGGETFGFDRYLNQQFYKSREWQAVRNEVIVRDNGCDLGIADRPISGKIYVHHMNPLGIEDIETDTEYLLNPDYLVAVSLDTHNAIHYGSQPKNYDIVERKPNDTCPWKK